MKIVKCTKPVSVAAALIGLSLLIFGCGTFQSPKTLDPGETTLGLWGVAAFQEDFVSDLGTAGIYLRTGVSEHFDIGLRYGLPIILIADAKYEVLQIEDFILSVDVGVGLPGDTSSGIIEAGILFGTEQVYGSMNCGLLIDENLGLTLAPEITVGAAFGKRFKVLPEVFINYTIHDGLHFGPGLAIQYTFGEPKDK